MKCFMTIALCVSVVLSPKAFASAEEEENSWPLPTLLSKIFGYQIEKDNPVGPKQKEPVVIKKGPDYQLENVDMGSIYHPDNEPVIITSSRGSGAVTNPHAFRYIPSDQEVEAEKHKLKKTQKKQGPSLADLRKIEAEKRRKRQEAENARNEDLRKQMHTPHIGGKSEEDVFSSRIDYTPSGTYF